MPLVRLVVFKFNTSTWTSTASSSLTLPSIYRAATFVMYPRRALGDITSVNDVAFSSEVCFHSRSPLAVFAFVCCGSGGCYLVNDAAFYRRFVFVLIHRTRSLQMTDLPAPQRKPNAALPAYNWGSSTSSPTVYSMNLLCLDLPPRLLSCVVRIAPSHMIRKSR